MSLTVRGVKAWLQRHAARLLVALAVLIVVLAVVVVAQALMLRADGWTVPLGNVAEWIGGFGSMAAFGAVLFAALEWRAGQAERRDEEANQARLIIVEPASEHSRIPQTLVIRNRSQSPVFNVFFHIGETARRMNSSKADWVIPGEAYWGLGTEGDPVLVPDGRFGPLSVSRGSEPTTPPTPPVITEHGLTPFPDDVVFTFTDVQGRSWKRVGAGQPTRDRDT